MVTIRDVARTAGVSIKTVSRVLTGNGYASAATRAQVERAAKKLRYVPNRIASSLASGHTLSIGMIVPDISSAYFSEVALGAETTATKAGYNLILCNTDGRPEQEKHLLHYLHCHHCGTSWPIVKNCADCNSADLISLGLGTERLEEVLQKTFPDNLIKFCE